MTAWAVVSLVIAVLYVVLRYGATASWALVVSQVLYLAPILAAAVLSAVAAGKAPTRGRARLIWLLYAAAVSLVLIYEAISATVTVMGTPDDPTAMVFADAVAVAATLTFLALVGTISSVDRLDRARALRVVLDIVAIGALVFAVVFRFWVAGLLDMLDFAQAVEAVRLAAYASVGILLVIGNQVAMSRIHRHGDYLWATLAGTGISVYGLGVALWPLWALSHFASVGAWWHGPLVSVILLAGYELFALGALARLSDLKTPWYDGAHMPESGAVWPGLVATTLVFTSVFFLGRAVISAPGGSPEELIYLTVLSVAVLCLVSRTALSSAEMWRLQSVAATDAVTGGHSQALLAERLAELVTVSGRCGQPFGLAAVNLDDFSVLNRERGYDIGDRVLAAVTDSLGSEADAENVFRMDGDEFVVLLPGSSSTEAEQRAKRLLAAIDAVGSAVAPITASIGSASYPADAESGEELLRKAQAAQIWAKYHGKHCVERYEKGLLRESSGRGGYGLLEARGSLDVALALVAVSDARDPVEYRHARNVAALSRLLAQYAGIDDRTADKIEIAAIMHDIGKVAVARSTTSSRAEAVMRRAATREHPSIGARLVGSLGVTEVADWVRSHHERWDGEGYPDGLREEEIPLGARIIALADAYDTMTEGTRAGRPMSKGAALQEIDLGIGTRFDPRLAEIFIALIGTTDRLGWSEDWTVA